MNPEIERTCAAHLLVDADTRQQPRPFVKNFCDFVNFSMIKFHRLRMNPEIERTCAAHLLVMHSIDGV